MMVLVMVVMIPAPPLLQVGVSWVMEWLRIAFLYVPLHLSFDYHADQLDNRMRVEWYIQEFNAEPFQNTPRPLFR